MNLPELEALIRRKDSELVEPAERLISGTLGAILKEIIFHETYRYWQFTPSPPSELQFIDRLCAWVSNNVSETQVCTMLRLVPHIQFIDRDDMLALYQTAFDGQITRWIMDRAGINFGLDSVAFQDRFNCELASTCFCPVTDSMDISQFHHVNKLAGRSERPSWRTLQRFGDVSKVKKYMQDERLTRLVLLEDFVGSARQSTRILRYSIECFGAETPVLFVPLVISAAGETNLLRAFPVSSSLSIAPVFVVPARAHVRPEKTDNEPIFFELVRELASATFDDVQQLQPFERDTIESPYGYGKVGTIVVMHTNCPNNTLPLIWHDAPRWRALFPRVSRT